MLNQIRGRFNQLDQGMKNTVIGGLLGIGAACIGVFGPPAIGIMSDYLNRKLTVVGSPCVNIRRGAWVSNNIIGTVSKGSVVIKKSEPIPSSNSDGTQWILVSFRGNDCNGNPEEVSGYINIRYLK
jgi:hypothetical protein